MTFVLGIVAVLGGVGGGVLFVPIIGGFFPFHLDFVRGAGLLVALAGALAAGPGLLEKGMADLRLAEGTVRTYSTAAQDQAERRIREIVAGVTASAGATFEITYERGSPPVVNDLALTERMVPTLQRLLGGANVQRIDPAMVAEEFSYFANEVPGFFYRLGVQKPGTISGDHHTPTFQADDASIPIGIRVMTGLVLDYLGG